MPGERPISNRAQTLLNQALSNWRQWAVREDQGLLAQPEVVRELLGGRTNKSFLVSSGAFQAVVRVNSPVSIKLGINRRREKKILGLLEPTGLIPKVFFIDDELLVSEFIEGSCLTDKSLKNSHIMESLSKALAVVQGVKMIDTGPRNYLDYCQKYLAQLSDKTVSPAVVKQIEDAAKAVDTAGWEPVICHHDMVPENIIVNKNGLFLIDWEYAALGHPGLDFLRLYGPDYASPDYQNGSLRDLFKVKQAMDKLWLAVQL